MQYIYFFCKSICDSSALYLFRYSLTGTSDFIIDGNTGLIKTNVIFSGRLGQILIFSVTASDLSSVSPKSTSEMIFVSLLDFQFLVQIVVDQTIDKTQLCLSNLISKLVEITSFQVSYTPVVWMIPIEIFVMWPYSLRLLPHMLSLVESINFEFLMDCFTEIPTIQYMLAKH